MPAFTAKDVQALREMTGVGMMDCKKALTETDGDMDKAVEFLREKGLATAAKKAGRIAAEGIVYSVVYDESGVGVVVEVNSETDFVAKNEDFQKFVAEVAGVIAAQNPADVDALMECKGSDGASVADMLRDKILVIGENLKIRRFVRVSTGVSVSYVHMGGKIGVLVNFEGDAGLRSNPDVIEMGKDVAMQIAAMKPLWLSRDQVDAETIEKEKEILMAQAMGEGKPQNVAEKIVAGRINKYYQENCLLDQAFVKDDKMTVAQYVVSRSKELGVELKLSSFTRFEKGEGLAKREDNFAEEVAGMIN